MSTPCRTHPLSRRKSLTSARRKSAKWSDNCCRSRTCADICIYDMDVWYTPVICCIAHIALVYYRPPMSDQGVQIRVFSLWYSSDPALARYGCRRQCTDLRKSKRRKRKMIVLERSNRRMIRKELFCYQGW